MTESIDQAALTKALINAAAAQALNESGCKSVKLFLPHVTEQLTVLHEDEGGPPRVVAVDERGQPRMGSRGAMTADEVVAQLRTRPNFERVGWSR